MELKKQVFAELDRVARPDAILASNTSTLDIDAIASATIAAAAGDRPPLLQPGQRHAAAGDRPRPADQPGGHRHVDGPGQDARQGRRAGRQLPRLRRQPHVRPLSARGPVPAGRRGDASRRSTPPWSISAWRWGRWPSATWRGWTSAGGSARNTSTWFPRACAQPLVADRLCEMGRYGQKTGAGWYRYAEGSRTPAARSRGRTDHRRVRPRRRHQAPDDRGRGDRRANDLRPGQRRGQDPRRRIRRCGPWTSTSSTSTATASRPIAAARCGTPTRWG